MRFVLFISFLLFGAVKAAYIDVDENLNTTELSVCSDSSSVLNFPSAKEELIQFVEYCSLAYCMPKNKITDGNLVDACPISSCTDSTGNKKIVYQFKGDISGLIVQDDTNKQIILVFKGTTSDKEWEIDFDTSHKKYVPYTVSQGINTMDFTCRGCQVHTGFYDATSVFMDKAFQYMQELHNEYPSYSIFVTGHSLGAALAVLAANELRLVGMDVTLVNYAGPKVGNPSFAEWMNDLWSISYLTDFLKTGKGSQLPTNTFTRVTSKGDIVPLVPLAAMNFAHSGSEIQIDRETNSLTVRGEWSLCKETSDLESISKITLAYITSGNWQYLTSKSEITEAHVNYFMRVTECSSA